MAERLEPGKIIPLKEDFLFKKVFGSNENIERLEELMSIYFDVDVKELKGNIVILNDNLRKVTNKTKDQKVDVKAEIHFQVGTKTINIEMNLQKGSTLERNVLYVSKILSSQLRTKQGYKNIKPIIQINFDNYEVNEKNERIVKRCYIKDETNTIITDVLEIDHVNIEKCKDAWYNNDIKKYAKKEQDLIRIGALFTIEEVEEFKTCLKEVRMSKEIKEDITEAVEEYSQDEELLELYDKDKIIEADRILIMEQAREDGLKAGLEEGLREGHKEGLKEGHKEGLKEGLIEGSKKEKNNIAKKLLDKKIDINIISETTGLSIDELEILKK